jgi:copper chaperone
MVKGRVRVCDAGMMCGGCVGTVKRLLEGHSAVGKANVNLATETALVRVSPFSTDAHSSLQAVAEIGASLVKVCSPLRKLLSLPRHSLCFALRLACSHLPLLCDLVVTARCKLPVPALTGRD